MRNTVIIGSAGQDGRILSAQLRAAGQPVVGFDAAGGSQLPVADAAQLASTLKALQPSSVFYLAAVHHSAEAEHEKPGALFRASTAVHLDAPVAVLDALAEVCPDARFFYAASSHVFGAPEHEPQNEATPFRPSTIYAITKAAGAQATAFYRRRGLHASVGILYNHESPLRPPGFLTRRVILAAREARRAQEEGRPFTLELGALAQVVDWSWAPDVTDAMQKIVGAAEPGDYVVASGQPHTVADLCRLAFSNVGLDYREWVRETPERLTRVTPRLVGDSSRLKRATLWRPTLTFEQMVSKLAEDPPDVW